jgi:hypothetical protein
MWKELSTEAKKVITWSAIGRTWGEIGHIPFCSRSGFDPPESDAETENKWKMMFGKIEEKVLDEWNKEKESRSRELKQLDSAAGICKDLGVVLVGTDKSKKVLAI